MMRGSRGTSWCVVVAAMCVMTSAHAETPAQPIAGAVVKPFQVTEFEIEAFVRGHFFDEAEKHQSLKNQNYKLLL